MKFDPHTLLALLNQCGFEFRRIGSRLQVAPIDRLTPEMREAIRRHKPELLPLLPEHQP